MKNKLRKTGDLKTIGDVHVPREAMTQKMSKEGIPLNRDPFDVAPIKRQLPGLDISLAKINKRNFPGTQS